MRILWLNHRDPEHPLAGGAERTLYEVGRRFVLAGHAVDVVSGGWPGAPARSQIAGMSVRRFPTALLPHAVLPLVLRSRPRPEFVIDDLAHVLPWGTPRLSHLDGAVFFRHLHARTLPGQVGNASAALLTRIERSYARIYAERPFVTETPGSARDLESLGIVRSRCRVILPGVDAHRFQPGARGLRPRMVYFGGMRPYKRPEHALRAFGLVRRTRPDAELSVVGDGPELPRLQRSARELGLQSNVTFHGRVPPEQLPSILQSSWVNIHCAVAEGWAYSILEAAACGVPTVAYRVPHLEDSVVEGQTARLTPDGDPAGLAAALDDVLGDIETWARRARAYAETLPWSNTADQWTTSLNQFVS
ncbi:MAG: glycosyltransferase family 4 protein [Thermoplasmata archaeon]|nr:glycosyltransferase family 4 protein [Thermoplasmata archaeon]